ncbi:MAG: hypothetical protein O2907_05395 [Proteobacteria bacterium]|nr:hypothetical protein [Pseudomonadota bacterium]MDA1063758.1 hypothetical protein [Pseudomonadota bacterium]
MVSATGKQLRLLLVGLLASSMLACGNPPTPPEAALRAWVVEGQLRAEAKDRSGLMDMISDDYADARGNDCDDIEKMFLVYFLRANNLKLLTSVEGVRVFGDTAGEIDLKVGMAVTHDGVLGFSADAYNFELELVRDGDDWLLIAGRWGETGEEIH